MSLIFSFRRRKFINEQKYYNAMELLVVVIIPQHTILSRKIVMGLSLLMTSMNQKNPTPNQTVHSRATKENPESLDTTS